jgi:hypothetical protein
MALSQNTAFRGEDGWFVVAIDADVINFSFQDGPDSETATKVAQTYTSIEDGHYVNLNGLLVAYAPDHSYYVL